MKRKRKGPGRPSKNTDPRRRRFLRAIAGGNTREVACLMAGFSTDSLARYIEDTETSDFAEQIAVAEAKAEADKVKIVRDAEPDDYKAAQWWLERRRPETWGRKDKTELSGWVGARPDLTKLTDAELAQWMELSAKVAP